MKALVTFKRKEWAVIMAIARFTTLNARVLYSVMATRTDNNIQLVHQHLRRYYQPSNYIISHVVQHKVMMLLSEISFIVFELIYMNVLQMFSFISQFGYSNLF